jgi:hypothetical protein
MKTQFGLFFVANSIKIMKQDVIVERISGIVCCRSLAPSRPKSVT